MEKEKENPQLQQLVNLFNMQSETILAFKNYHLFNSKLDMILQKLDFLLKKIPSNDKEELN